ncbi:MAG TPA: AbrB/MazE/SpoVT family DNA-binding domain-containing protein [Candidatus Nanoarchaeia archaeon]|nr:AbrB/MazE/SpoVT family DNA-binding domain-containing protein [Candidatus Nanoarchaeia archaeon]
MDDYEITTITSRGQVTIPQSFREREHIQTGDKLVVKDVNGTIILKKLDKSILKNFFKTMEEVGKHVSQNDIKRLREESESQSHKKTKKWM